MQTKKQAAANGPKRPEIDIRWHPRATAIADGPRQTPGQRVDQWGGMGHASLSPCAVNYQGNTWTLAWSAQYKTLWVLTQDEYTVLQNRSELVDIALIVAKAGSVSQKALDEAQAAERLASLAGPAKPRPRTAREAAELAPSTDKEQCLRLLTAAAAHAFVSGATMDEVRGAVYAAMGLDFDDSPQ